MPCHKGHCSFTAITMGQCLADVMGDLPLSCRSQHFGGVHGDFPTSFPFACGRKKRSVLLGRGKMFGKQK